MQQPWGKSWHICNLAPVSLAVPSWTSEGKQQNLHPSLSLADKWNRKYRTKGHLQTTECPVMQETAAARGSAKARLTLEQVTRVVNFSLGSSSHCLTSFKSSLLGLHFLIRNIGYWSYTLEFRAQSSCYSTCGPLGQQNLCPHPDPLNQTSI